MKASKHRISTRVTRNWTTEGLFKGAGVAFPLNNQICYMSCCDANLVDITRAEKYGYFQFLNAEQADWYQKAFEHQQLQKTPDKLFHWRPDPDPLGPKLFTDSHTSSSSHSHSINRQEVQQIVTSELSQLTGRVQKVERDRQRQYDDIKNLFDLQEFEIKKLEATNKAVELQLLEQTKQIAILQRILEIDEKRP